MDLIISHHKSHIIKCYEIKNFYICEMKCERYLIYRKLCLCVLLSTLVILSFFASSNVFQNQIQLIYARHHQISPLNDSHYYSEHNISNILIEQFKEIVFDHPSSSNSSSSSANTSSVSNSSISMPIVVGIVSPDGTQISGYGNISNFNSTMVDGNAVFDIAYISKTFVAIILADMVNQGLVKLNDPIEKYLPVGNVTVPSYNGHKITLEDLATHTSGLPDFPTGWIRNHSYTTQEVYDFVSNTTLSGKPVQKQTILT
jgi:hypothetical protein